MFKIFGVVGVCAIFTIFGVLAGPTQISVAEKTFRNDVNYPSVHMTLLSIEDRLRNIENSLSVQCATAINGKIDYYGRKIDNIEKDLSRFQVYMRMELDKISENISNKNFKDDITKDRIIRKIDTIYERIDHKLGNIEGQVDITNIKSQNAREMVLTKLEKMEESLTIRDADMEAELADAVAAIDDLKTTCTNMEENIINVTKDSTKTFFKSNEKAIKKQHSQTINFLEATNKSLSLGLANIQETVNFLVNQTNNGSNVLQRAKDELNENLNEYANKITDIYSDLWKKSDTLDHTVQNLAKIANLTRSEQQNGLRALMVQVGRKIGKQGVQSDASIDNQKLAELSQKIDSNFENVMLAQNLFLESCHRVQMDESQLESQISMVLDKLIDIFENKTSVGPKDIKQLEQLIRTHDSNIRRSIYHVTNNLLTLMQNTTDGNGQIIDYINNQRSQLEALHMLLQDILNFSNDSEQTHSILETLQGFQQQLNETNHQTHTTLAQINSTTNFIIKMLNVSQINPGTNNAKLQQTLEFIKNIYHILTSIEMKINKSYLDYFFNKYNVDVIAHRFGKKLNDYIQNIDEKSGTEVENKTNINNEEQIPKLIFEIFGENSNQGKAVDPYDDFPYTIKRNSSETFNKSGDEVEHIVLLCSENASINCDKINNTKYDVVKQNETENDSNIPSNNCLPNYIDLIDVRSNSAVNFTSNCNLTNNTANPVRDDLSNITKNLENKNENTSNKCLPKYIDLIDVRSNYGPNTASNCTNIAVNATTDITNTTKFDDENLESYDIDVRYETSNKSSLNLPNTNTTNSVHIVEEPFIDLFDEVSQEQYVTNPEVTSTEKLDTNAPSATEASYILSTLDLILNRENKIVETTTEEISLENWTGGQITTINEVVRTTTEENYEMNSVRDDQTTLASLGEDNIIMEDNNYATSSLEDDSTEITNDFEYTNHEYH